MLTDVERGTASRGDSGHGPDASFAAAGQPTLPPGDGQESRPELADVARLARRLMLRAVSVARAEDAPAHRLLRDHLGPGTAAMPVVSGSWPAYDHVNVQAGLEAWLADEGRAHHLAGLTGFRHMEFGLADLTQPGPFGDRLGVGSVATSALSAGPGGQTRACVQCGLYLVDDAGTRFALLLRGPGDRGPSEEVSLEVAAADQAAVQRVLNEIRQLAVEHNVFRGHVITFGGEVFGRGRDRGAMLRFLDRPQLDRAEVVLPPALLDGIERQVLGVARHAGRLLASGQHLKRGVLLHGAAGTGKTHTIRYLLGRLPAMTVVVISGHALQWIAEACSVARVLQPSMVVIEDVDLIAEERGPMRGQHPLLFQLLNEMDGLGEDIDVTFLLTTNRADLLETALAARPGRVDHAARLPLPDADARRQLIELYRGRLVLDLSDPEIVVKRTDGVTASFLKELLRRAALLAAETASAGPAPGNGSGSGEASASPGDGAPLHISDAHMNAALDQLLDVRGQLTRALLGGSAAGPGGHRPMGADAVIRKPVPGLPEPGTGRPGSRLYSGPGDLRAMQDLASRTWTPGAHWHVGDLAWQRSTFPARAPGRPIRLWTAPGGTVLAWGRLGEPAHLDLAVDPACPELADEVLGWFAETATHPDHTVTVTDREPHLIAALIRHRYWRHTDGPCFTLQTRDLADLPDPMLPAGYLARPVGPDDLSRRAQSHRAAWQSDLMTDEHYREITRTWPYRRELDWVAEAQDSSFASNCLLWLDEATGTVLMEPVGTHPQHRRRGLARAVCLAALHAARDAGATTAVVTPRGDPGYPVPALLYRSMGFRDQATTVAYRR
jgi:predicted N-acetyltransferase YhbS